MSRKVILGGVAAATAGMAAYAMMPPKGSSVKQSISVKTPEFNLPEKVQYLVVGGGAASFGAYRAIKGNDPKAQILIVGNEFHQPYMRPPLSKELWKGKTLNDKMTFTQWNGKERSLMFEHSDYFTSLDALKDSEAGGVAYAGGIKAVKIDPQQQIVYFQDGRKITYERCLLSTGSLSKTHPILSRVSGIEKYIIELRTIEDFKKLQKSALEGSCIAVVGGGAMASELTCNMAEFGKEANPLLKVVQIFPEEGNMRNILPEFLSKWLSKKIASVGAQVISGVDIINAEIVGNSVKLKLTNGQTLTAEKIVVAVGAEPNVNIAKESGLEVDEKNGGVVVNAELEARRNLWGAGDLSSFFDPRLGRRRFESHDHAVMTGRLAGKNMTGAKKPFTKQNIVWTDVGNVVSFEGVGLLDPSLKTYSVFFPDSPEQKTDFDGKISKGVVFYKNDKDLVVGVLLCNIFGRMSDARKIIAEQKPLDLKDVAKVFYEKASPE